ncbi:MAG: HAMP domain-containing protein, partial [Planctomycetes bacterium]|nr:HAMP domain-containing protein [Planctomycetota bacterium]
MRFLRFNLTPKLVLSYLVMGLAPVAIVMWIASTALNGLLDRTGMRARDLSMNIADKIDRNMFERYGDVQAFGYNTAVLNRDSWYQRGAAASEIVRVMNRYVDAYDIYALTILVDTEGRVIAVNDCDSEGKPVDTAFIYDRNYADAAWFKACKQGEFTTRRPHTSKGNDGLNGTFIEPMTVDPDVKQTYQDDALTVGFSAPVKDAEGKVVAFWSNRSKFSNVETIIAQAYRDVGEEFPMMELTLLDEAGRVIVDYDPALAGSKEIRHDFAVLGKLNLAEKGVVSAKDAIEGKSGYCWSLHARKQVKQAAGYAHLGGAMGFPGMGWSVLARIPEADVAAVSGVSVVRQRLMVAVAASAGAILIVGWALGRIIARPIVMLAKSARDLAAGEHDVKVTYHSNDEIGRLADGFRAMIDSDDQRRELEAEAAESARSLQAKVDELLVSVRAAAAGNLATNISIAGDDAIGQLADGLRAMIQSLRTVVEQIHDASNQFAEGARVVSEGSTSLANGAQTQSATVEELSASVRALTE